MPQDEGKRITTWFGRPIQELSREELLAALERSIGNSEYARQSMGDVIRILDLARKARPR